MSLARSIKKHLPAPLRDRVLPAVARFVYRNNLSRLAAHFGTDKWNDHWYTQHYQRYFEPLRKLPLNLLEIGIGGYDDSAEGGQSLRMWKAFFPRARIVGLDLHDKTQFAQSRIDIRVGDQTDATLLAALSAEYGGFDIIIDDGSHLSAHVIRPSASCFPCCARPASTP